MKIFIIFDYIKHTISTVIHTKWRYIITFGRVIKELATILMKTQATLLILFLTWTLSFSQIEYGKYRVCLDLCYYDYCHGRLTFDFMDNDSCEIKYEDDVTVEIAQGYYHINDSMITFKPKVRPDSIQISYKYDRRGNGKNQSYLEYQQKHNENVIWVLELTDKRLANIELYVHKDSKSEIVKTDSLGYARYFGEVADSISLKVCDKVFSIYPDKNNKPSWIKIYLDFHYLDLFDRIEKLKYDNGIYWFEYKCDNNEIKKRPLIKIK